MHRSYIIFNTHALVARCYLDALRHHDDKLIRMCCYQRASLILSLCGRFVCVKMVRGLLKSFSKMFSFRSGTQFVKIHEIIKLA